jgi:FkbM family methyltransferase
MSLLGRKLSGGLRLAGNLITGVREDGPLMGRVGAFRFHVRTLLNQARYYAGAGPVLKPIQVRLAGASAVTLRPMTSDYDAFRQIFRDREYASLDDTEQVEFILDCGANVGLASIYFLNRFPRARVLAVEPDPENVAICRRNLAPYGARATVLQAGVWGCATKLTVVPSPFGANEKWGVQVRPFCAGDSVESAVEAWDIPALIAHAGVKRVDILKVDIERSEMEVFASSPERWLRDVRNLVIELHGEDCSRAFFAAMEQCEYRLTHRGDLTYCLDMQPKAFGFGAPESVRRGALKAG